MKTTETTPSDISGSYRTSDNRAQIDFGITYRNGFPEFTASGHYDGGSGQCLDSILAAYPDDEMVKGLHTLWTRYHLKEMREAMREVVRAWSAKYPASSFYELQADSFLSRNGIRFRATLSDYKTADWQPSGHHYRVTLSKPSTSKVISLDGGRDRENVTVRNRIVFDFWGSQHDMAIGKREVSAYTVLACISGDVNCPDTFEDFCSEYGYEADSIKALQTFRRCSRFSARLRSFFTPSEIEELSEIQ